MFKRSLDLMLVALVVLTGCSRGSQPEAEPARPKQLDLLSYVSDDIYGVIVLHPQQIARSPEVAAMLKNELFVAAFKGVGFDPLKIEQVLLLIPAPAKEPGLASDGPTAVLRFSPPLDAENVAKGLLVKPLGPLGSINLVAATVTVAGKKCYKFEEAAEEPAKTQTGGEPVRGKRFIPRMMTCVADDRTVLVSPRGEAGLKKMLAAGEVKTPLTERLRGLDVSDDVAAVFVLEPMREEVKAALAREKRRSPTSPAISLDEIMLLLRSATFKISLADAARSSVLLEAEDVAGAAKVEELLKTFRQVATDGLAGAPKRFQGMPEEFRKQIEEETTTFEKLLDAMTSTRSGAQVTITLKGTEGLTGVAAVKAISGMFTPVIIPSKPRPPGEGGLGEPGTKTSSLKAKR